MFYQGSHWARPRSRFLGLCVALAWGASFAFSSFSADGASLILNEYNSVDSVKYLMSNSYSALGPLGENPLSPIKEDAYFRTVAGMPDGRIEGNGGNWVELVVVDDHLDLRGWKLKWAEPGVVPGVTNGTNPWYGSSTVEQGIITFASLPQWADLRSGTIITLSEKGPIDVNTDFNGTNRNFTKSLAPGAADVTIPLNTDLSFDPDQDDWWINVATRPEALQAGPLVTTVTNVTGEPAGSFSVGYKDWEMGIYNASGALVYGPIGEKISTFGTFSGKITANQAGRMESDPDALVLNNNDYDTATSTSYGLPNEYGGEYQDFSGLRVWAVPEPSTFALLGAGCVMLLLRRRKLRAA